MKFDIITIFPKIFDSYLNESILSRAQKSGLIEIKTHNLRDWTNDKHKTVDDSPYGGGVGMVMMAEPILKAIYDISEKTLDNKKKIILLTPRGKRFTQNDAKRFLELEQMIFIAGRYEGVDERVVEFVDEQISIGDFVLNGGEVAAMAIIESVARLIPGVLGKDESSKEESFSDEESAEYPQYTRPEILKKDNKELRVPEILLSGNHAKVEKWRKENRRTLS
jgi:tRNA (guanine37-N1)-methyltransferase